MDNISFYQVDAAYIDYLAQYAPHLFHNKSAAQQNERKHIGVILMVNGVEYFAPLSSAKPKHKTMRETLDFIKIKDYAVINLNNMFPVPPGLASYVDFSKEKDDKYRSLLLAEYRIIKAFREKIRKNASIVYNHKLQNGNSTGLSKRCNDFLLLEEACKQYINRERFDYTEWRQRYFGNMSAEEFNNAAVQYAREHPFEGRKADG